MRRHPTLLPKKARTLGLAVTGIGTVILLFAGTVQAQTLIDPTIHAYVVNFDVPGGTGGANYSGQGVLSDSGHNYWNPIVNNGTTPASTDSDGISPNAITLTTPNLNAYGGNNYGGVTQGTPPALFTPFVYSKSSYTLTLNNVAAGVYNLYLYGMNGSGGGGSTKFTVGGISITNTCNTGNQAAFLPGVDYGVISNIVLASTGTITIGVAASGLGSGQPTEADFNGLQLAAVTPSPSIGLQPASTNPVVGQAGQLTATAFGALPLAYQWQKGTNGVYINSTDTGDVSGSKTNILNFSAVTTSDAANYRLIVTNAYGAVTSQVANVTATLWPSISVQPTSATLLVGAFFQLTATTFGALPLAYQWQKGTNGVYINSIDGGDVSGSKANILNFSATALSDAANYRLVVTNAYGAATSQVANIATTLRFPVGAMVPFTEYEAEAGTLGGGATVVSMIPPLSNPNNGAPVLECSGAAYVSLNGTGQSVSWVNNSGQSVTALNVRIQIPDAPTGYGITNTIDLYVDGTFRQALTVNSAQSYLYNNNNRDKNPADGPPSRVWDEYPFFVNGSAIAPGSTITFQKDATNTAAFYNIDLIDLETPPPPLTQPTNSLSITSYGAVSNNPAVDNTTAIQNCMNAAQSQRKIVWIPAGTFYMGQSTTAGVNPTGVTVEGAGMWYSILYSNPSNPVSGGQMIGGVSCALENFAMDGNSISAGCASASSMSGSNWLVNAVWVRHLSLAVWGGGDTGTLVNMRVNNTWSDGCNMNNFAGVSTSGSNLTESNNFLRYTGDDAFAVNGTDGSGHTPMTGITIINNTIVQTAGRIVVYGGNNVVIKYNYCHDVCQNDGIQVGYHQQTASITNVLVEGNVVLRCGSPNYGGVPGMVLGSESTTFVNEGTNKPYLDSDITVIRNTISDPYYGGLQVQICSNVVFEENVISSPGTYGIFVEPYAIGNAVIQDNIVSSMPVGQAMFYNSASGYDVSTATDLISPPIEAASYNSLSSASAYLETCGEGGEDLCHFGNGDYVEYNNYNLNGINRFAVRVATANAGGNIEIHLDSPAGTLAGTCQVTNTGGWQTWNTFMCNVSGASGYHNVYLVFAGGSGVMCSMEWFALLGAGNRIEAASYNSGPGIQTESCVEGGLDVTNIANGSYAVFNSINLNGIMSFQARVASAGAGGTIQIHLDSPAGTLLGTCAVPATGGGQVWSTQSINVSGASGYHNVYLVFGGSGANLFALQWFAFSGEAAPAPAITTQLVSQTVNIGGTAVFTVVATDGGAPPLTYQWQKNGTNLSDGGNIFGSATAILTVSNAAAADNGTYTVVVSNAYSSVTSSPARLQALSIVVGLSVKARSGGTLITPTIRAFSSYYNSGQYVRNVTNLVQNNFVPGEPGLSGPGYYTDTHDNGEEDVWHHASGDNNPFVTFDLGITGNLLITRLWNLNQGISSDVQNGAKNVRVSVSADGATFRAVGTNTLNEAAGTTNEPAQDFATPAPAIRYVKLEPLDGYGGGWNGLSAVRFVVAGPQSTTLLTATIQGIVGLHYQIQYNSVLDGTANWQVAVDVPALPTSPYSVALSDGSAPGTQPRRFYRAVWMP